MTPVKRFAMGRFSHENVAVMKDQKTVYQSDDGTKVVFFKFVATAAGDLSAGTLYAAKAKQNDDQSFDITWVELATAADADVKTWIDEYNPGAAKAGTYITDAEVTAWAAGTAADNRVAFLESRKAAAAKGATAEWEKMEGVLANPEGTAL